jgi:lysophospholipase L1-like esterase
MIGANDQFTTFPDPYGGIYAGTWTATQINDWTDDVAANIDTALDTVLPTGVPLVLFGAPDYGITPIVQSLFPRAAGRQAVSDVIENVLNPKIEAIAEARSLPYVDLFGALEAVFGPQTSLNSTLTIGGVDIYLQEVDNFGDNSDAGFVHDEIHPHTALQGLIANLVMEGLNLGYGADFALFSEEEILTNAGLSYSGSDTLAPQIGDYSDYVTNYVPEPSSLVLAGCGALGCLAFARRRPPPRRRSASAAATT